MSLGHFFYHAITPLTCRDQACVVMHKVKPVPATPASISSHEVPTFPYPMQLPTDILGKQEKKKKQSKCLDLPRT